ncbi:MAG: hypothetical protein ACM3P0_19425, partial [Acidobacteriota bacterium]
MNRRKFFKILTLGGLGTAFSPALLKDIFPKHALLEKPLTNINDAMKYPRTEFSMPGRMPGKVVQASCDKCIVNNKIDFNSADEMLRQGLLKLTGEGDIPSAWRLFVKKSDVIGIKVNPIGGAQLSTSTEVVKSVINQLE